MKKFVVSTIALLSAVSLTGCGMFKSQIPELTEEEESLVIEYATEVLLHYDRLNGDKIRPIKYDVVTDEGVTVSDEEYAGVVKDEVNPDPGIQLPEPDPASEVTAVDNTVPEDPSATVVGSLSELFGLDGINIESTGYDVTDFYPSSPADYFVMNATEGNKLVILKFVLSNVSGSDQRVEIPYGDVKYKITLNDTTKNALTTLLINDMGTFTADMAAGASFEVVLVGEFPAADATSISSLSLSVKRESGTCNIIFK
ncbi:MAG: hypothetical protein K6A38_07070 [Lachnospiraceae bacterium]|nr:hypothetical protein [Lachnospiraceae bacterium]